jgi:hypothetical protein
VADVRARVYDDLVRIIVVSQGDADVDLWAAERKVDLFEKVFGRPVRFSSRDTDRHRRTRRRNRAARSASSNGTHPNKAKKSSR